MYHLFGGQIQMAKRLCIVHELQCRHILDQCWRYRSINMLELPVELDCTRRELGAGQLHLHRGVVRFKWRTVRGMCRRQVQKFGWKRCVLRMSGWSVLLSAWWHILSGLPSELQLAYWQQRSQQVHLQPWLDWT